MSDPQTRLSDFLPYLLSITSNAVSDRISVEYHARFGLKIAEWRVMAVLGDLGGQTQRALVGATRMDKVAVNRACKVLEQRQLIARSPNDRDGRSHHLELTSTGRSVFDEIMPIALAMEARLFAPLGPADRARFKKLLEEIRELALAKD
ncbi:MAG: MarR family winged helix-turn-helix transcriptional regulator [Novosphingobium sp.]|uniref:MarR family winged helix-turn-helix transcriptional regulator n=1 Tax=Novosphingobium sp. TaxID=1874826 RepID=UPI0032BDB9DE